MNIEKWDIDKIMRLPDWCFGRKFLLSCDARAYSEAYAFDISKVGLPDRAVMWELLVVPYNYSSTNNWIRLAVGDKVPASAAEMLLLDPLIMGFGYGNEEPRKIYLVSNLQIFTMSLRTPSLGNGRRLILEAYAEADKIAWVRVTLLVSSIPKEVPDWIYSGQGDFR